MKKTILIALVIALALTFTSCPEEEEDGGKGGPTKWTAVAGSTFGTSAIRAIAYGNNGFVAGGWNGKMAYSDDNGETWTAVSDSTFGTSYINGIAYGIADGESIGRFVAVGEAGKMAYSDDNGETWTAVSNSTFGGTSSILGIAYGNNRFVAWDNWGGRAYSDDGITWTYSSSTSTRADAIVYGGDRFVTGWSYSTNGTSWKSVTTNSVFDTTNIRGIAYGIADGESVGRFVAVGASGKMAYSEDGASWKAVANSTFGNSDIWGIAYGIADGESVGRFVAVGGSGKIAYSDDGENWTSVSNSRFATARINAIAYGNNRFVAVGDSDRMAYADW